MQRIVIYIIIFFNITFSVFSQDVLQSSIGNLYNGHLTEIWINSNAHTSVYPFLEKDFETKNDTCKIERFYINKRFSILPIVDVLPIVDNSRLLFNSNLGSNLFLNVNKDINVFGNIFYGVGNFTNNEKEFYTRTNFINGYSSILPLDTSSKFQSLHKNSLRISYNASDHFTIESGYGANGFGDGFRTFFLSNQTTSYPFLKVVSDVWKFRYTNLWAILNGNPLGDLANTTFNKKYASFHHLSWNITKWLNISMFEAVIWKKADSVSNRGFDINYLNPVIFYRPIEFSVGSPDNSLLGLAAKIKYSKNNFLYGQLMLDDVDIPHIKDDIKHIIFPKNETYEYGFWQNKQALQIGLKGFDFIFEGFDYIAEFNMSRPYTFSHRQSILNYAHSGQSLAHPLGANFKESLIILSYQKKDWEFVLQYQYLNIGFDSTLTHVGQNINNASWDALDLNNPTNIPVAPWHHKIGQGVNNKVNSYRLSLYYLIKPEYNLRLFTTIQYRKLNEMERYSSDIMVLFGVKSSIFNKFYDF